MKIIRVSWEWVPQHGEEAKQHSYFANCCIQDDNHSMVHNLSNSCNWADMQVGTQLDNQLGVEVVVSEVGLKLLVVDYLRAEKLMAVYCH